MCYCGYWVVLFEVPKENHTPRVLLSYSVKHLHYACTSIVGRFKDKHPINAKNTMLIADG